MATVTGKLTTITEDKPEQGSVEIALCGYGARVPRINAKAIFGRATSAKSEAVVGTDGTFSVLVEGNDVIVPAGTYYTVTVKDSNGDIVQVNAYRFIDDQTYVLNNVDPYDPNQPPPPLPPLITNLLEVIPASWGMVYHGSIYTAFKTTLTLDVGGTSMDAAVPGNLYTFIIVQDATGGHAFAWPGNVRNAAPVSLKPLVTTTQTFIADDNGQLWAIGPGTWSL